MKMVGCLASMIWRSYRDCGWYGGRKVRVSCANSGTHVGITGCSALACGHWKEQRIWVQWRAMAHKYAMAKEKLQQLCWVSEPSTNDEEGNEPRGRVLTIVESDFHEHGDEEDDSTTDSDFAESCGVEGAVADSGGTVGEHRQRDGGPENAVLSTDWENFVQELEEECMTKRPSKHELLLRNSDGSPKNEHNIGEADGFLQESLPHRRASQVQIFNSVQAAQAAITRERASARRRTRTTGGGDRVQCRKSDKRPGTATVWAPQGAERCSSRAVLLGVAIGSPPPQTAGQARCTS